MPALGMNQDTGRLVAWRRKEGERVAKGEPLMEVETDKATVEVESPESGVLTQVTATPGDEVPVGAAMALILAAGEAPAASPPDFPRRMSWMATSLSTGRQQVVNDGVTAMRVPHEYRLA